MGFPATRMRRLRRTAPLRELVRETRLSAGDLVMPLFAEEGADRSTPIEAMPGISRLPVSALAREAGEIAALGIPAVLLFGIPAHKDEEGSAAWDEDGVVQHRILAADVIGRDGKLRLVGDLAHHVQIRERWLDHDDVGALSSVQLSLTQCLA